MNAFLKKAIELDAKDPLKVFRGRFSLPKGTLAPHKIYFCNNSLGLPPVDALSKMEGQIRKWSQEGAHGWFHGDKPWFTSLDNPLKKPLSHLLGAKEEEVAVMNSLTVNLHLLLASFYQPTEKRYKIAIDAPAFPSDLYAVKSHLRFHGYDPEEALIILEPHPGEHLLRHEDIEGLLISEGAAIALVFLNSVNFLTGQVLDMAAIAKVCRQQGCILGCDLAHAAGNIPLDLHAWGIDFAVGCTYKYLCSGPGGPGFAFVHASHHESDLPRLSGWWGNDPKKRFQMQLQPEFIPYGGAGSWQVSTPSILAITPLLASLEIFKEAGIERLRKKSMLQTAFLLELLDGFPSQVFTLVTPRSPEERGCQLSLLIHKNAEECLSALERDEVICDFRPPNILRITPSPLYNTFFEIWEFVRRFLKLNHP